MNKFLGCIIFSLIVCQNISAQCGISFPRAVSLPKPVYSENITLTNDLEVVEVKIEIDEQGRVNSAKAVSGNRGLWQISETAALQSVFKVFPKIKMIGTIKYEFQSKSGIKVSEFIPDNIDEWVKRANVECHKLLKPYSLRYKADSSILSIVERLIQNRTEPNSNETGFVVNGKAKIGIKLKALNSKTIKELKSFGVEVIGIISSEKAIVGQIPIGKIEHLLEQDNIVYVFPFWIKSPPKAII